MLFIILWLNSQQNIQTKILQETTTRLRLVGEVTTRMRLIQRLVGFEKVDIYGSYMEKYIEIVDIYGSYMEKKWK